MSKIKYEKMLLKGEVIVKLQDSFAMLSKLLSEGTKEYEVYRGCLYGVSEDVYELVLLCSNIDGNWRVLSLSIDFDANDIIYEKKTVPFKNTRGIMSAVDTIIFEDLEKIPPIDRVYFELNNNYKFKNGYYVEASDGMSYVMLDVDQEWSSKYCFTDAGEISLDKWLTMDWKGM